MGPSRSDNGGTHPTISHFRRVLNQTIIDDAILNAHYEGDGTLEHPYIVTWLPSDPCNPMNYPSGIKWTITALVAIATLSVSFASSAYSGGLREIRTELGVSEILVTLGISLSVLGFALGPLMWAPLSEIFGRQYIFVISFAFLAIISAVSAASQNMTTLAVTRFLAGALGSSPLANGGGVLADMFPTSQRGMATTFYAAASFLGPVIGPIVGGFVGQIIGWRWIQGIIAIFTGVTGILCALLVPETYSPVLLNKRALKLSRITSKTFKTQVEIDKGKTTISKTFTMALTRPWILLFGEPIVFLLSLYVAIIYGTLYMLFPAFPIVFEVGRGWSGGIGGLAFLRIAVGMVFAIACLAWQSNRYARNVASSLTGHLEPEQRLPPALIGCIALPIGLFWFAWTNGPNVHWIVSIIASVPFGFGMVLIFNSITNYLIDTYVIYTASAMAASSIIRSLFGAAFPLFTSYMYQNLGIHWASSIPAFLAHACVPFPYLFFKFGARIRMRCKYSREAALALSKLRG